MAERKERHIDNLKKANEIIRGNEGKPSKIDEFISFNNDLERSVKGIKSTISEKLKKLSQNAQPQVENTTEIAEEKPTEKVEKVKNETAEKVVEKKKDEPVMEEKKATESVKTKENKPEPKKEEKKAEPPKVEVAPVDNVEKKDIKKEEKKQDVKENISDNKPEIKKESEKPQVKETEKPVTEEKKVEDKKVEEKPAEVPKRPSFIVRREGPIQKPERRNDNDRHQRGEYNNRGERGERRPRGEYNNNRNDGGYNNRNSEGGYNNRPPRDGQNNRGGFNNHNKPDFNNNNNNRGGRKPGNNATFIAPPIVTKDNDKRNYSKKKQNDNKSYEEKKVMNKRALIKNQVDIDDFDENKTGYRKFRPVKKAKEKAEVTAIKIEKAVINTEIIPLKVLSEKIGITAAEITKRLFKEGIMKTINDSVDFDTAAFIADDLGIELELKLDKTAEDVLSENFEGVEDTEADLVRRPPVVTVMGHVDHGKTSCLDRIRKTNVTAGEAGGITQHIGAYQVKVKNEVITFLDTPGHAAFTAMRARGAQATDIAVLVVAADDGIMPQTIEAINHAKAADVPIIVAINKIDKPEANIERIKTQLTENGLLPEEWGGDTIICPVSAKTGEGFDGLLESILLVAEIKDLKANPDRKAKGVVIEAKLDQSKGPIATILVQNGTLKVTDSVIVGTVTGKIRAMSDDKGKRVRIAGPSTPVSIMGLDEVPNSGDILYAVEHEKLSKLVAEERKNKERESMIKSSNTVTLDDVFSKIAEGEMKGLNLIVKADVQGSVEAVKQSLEKLSNEEVKVNVIHSAVGAIKESDIMLAESSNAIIIGFNVRPDSNAKQIAESSGVDIKLYRVIYEAIEDVEKALKGMLAPKFKEVYMGKAEVREVFKISGVGQVAGCYVTEGKIIRNSKLRIYRDDVMITEGNVLQLKRFKDDVKEVLQGFECGISIEKFNDIKVGDFIESYQVEETKD